MDDNAVMRQPLLFCHFAGGIGEPKYLQVTSYAELSKTLLEALDTYNEINAAMNLVLFDAAIEHVLRINRFVGYV